MSLSSFPSTLQVDVQPGRPPILHVEAGVDLLGWAGKYRTDIREAVTEFGSLHVRGLGLSDEVQISAVTQVLADGLTTEREAFASREDRAGGLYSSSAWPANQQMCMHHERSYGLDFPSLMMFGCITAPTVGGAIGLADSVKVLEALPAELVDRFGREGWILTRSYNDEIGLSAADAFGTADRGGIEDYCRSNDIQFDWQDDGGLRTTQHRGAVIQHPATGERCWFNQVAFLSEWTLNPEVHEFLVDVYGRDGLPFNTRFGNGDAIDQEVVQTINQAYDAHVVCEPLEAGDLVIVDNIRTAHSREPFEGDREVVVAMGDPARWPQH